MILFYFTDVISVIICLLFCYYLILSYENPGMEWLHAMRDLTVAEGRIPYDWKYMVFHKKGPFT